MGAGDVAAFREAGAALAGAGLVRGAEGNLSRCDGDRLTITRTGCSLGEVGPEDVLEGTLAVPPEGASSDLAVHLSLYAERGPGAVAHAHPPGTLEEHEAPAPGRHGVYVHAPTLEEAVEEILSSWAP